MILITFIIVIWSIVGFLAAVAVIEPEKKSTFKLKLVVFFTGPLCWLIFLYALRKITNGKIKND